MAAEFHGGIADGRSFNIARLPVYVRVVHGPENRPDLDFFDVLDQLEDEPYESDDIHVYRRVNYGFVCGRGRNSSASGLFALYEPAEGFEGRDIRTREDWQAAVAAVTGDTINDEGEVVDGG